LIPASYAWIALEKALDRLRSDVRELLEVDPAGEAILLDSIADVREASRWDALSARFDPFLDPFGDPGFDSFPLIPMDLAEADGRRTVFLAGFDWVFAFVAICRNLYG
jgi:hypothetical protein